MKTNITGRRDASRAQVKPAKRPENKDDLDSREGEEQFNKGDDVTHNKKEKHSALKKKG